MEWEEIKFKGNEVESIIVGYNAYKEIKKEENRRK